MAGITVFPLLNILHREQSSWKDLTLAKLRERSRATNIKEQIYDPLYEDKEGEEGRASPPSDF